MREHETPEVIVLGAEEADKADEGKAEDEEPSILKQAQKVTGKKSDRKIIIEKEITKDDVKKAD